MKGKKNVFILNGPILSGKDAIVDKIIQDGMIKASKGSFKTHLVKLVCTIYGVTKDWWDDNYTREGKEIPRPELNGLSMRQAQIFVSETVIKPNLGRDYFGLMEGKRISDIDDNIILFSDGGFYEEVNALEPHFDVHVIRLHRHGYRYGSNDSRSYIKDDEVECPVIDYHNIYDLDAAVKDVSRIIEDFLKQKESQ